MADTDDVQITIPTFEDDDNDVSFVPLGVPKPFSFGHSGHDSGSGQESPTLFTPIPFSERPDRQYFHSRGDSVTSEDSNYSAKAEPLRSTTTLAQSSQTSVASASFSFPTRKSSFASLKAAFKTSKPAPETPVPPVPPLDSQVHGVPRTPANRSNTSLNQSTPTASRRKLSTATTASPPYGRPSTPASLTGGRVITTRTRGHSYARSNHSHNGSLFHYSDGGSDGQSAPFRSTSPPPVPRMPNGLGRTTSQEGMMSFEDNSLVQTTPETPAEYALHAVFMRFVSTAEAKISDFDNDDSTNPLLTHSIGPEVDPELDSILSSLAQISQKHTKLVIDSVLRWRRTQVSPSSHHGRTTPSRSFTPAGSHERQALASNYIMCRALTVIVQSLPKATLSEPVAISLEELAFEQYKNADLKLLSQSQNYRDIIDLFAGLLKHLASLRFLSVTDRFLSTLAPLNSGQMSKESELRYANVIRGLTQIEIKVFPPELFEDGAEFLDSLAPSFVNSHGQRLKSVFAETLNALLHATGKTAQAEVNHPQWSKAVETIYSKALTLRARYSPVSYPLIITAMCLSPQETFIRGWMAPYDLSLAKLKEKNSRFSALNGLVRLIWTYLFRSREPASTSTSKLDTIFRQLFPPNRTSVYPADENLDPFVCIVHFVIARHADYGIQLVSQLLQERAVPASDSKTGNLDWLAPERMIIAIKSSLLSVHLLERDQSYPPWPSSPDFSSTPLITVDYPLSSEELSAAVLSKPTVEALVTRCSAVVATIATALRKLSKMVVFDEQFSLQRSPTSYDEPDASVIRHHPEGSVMYGRSLIPYMDLLAGCFSSWPRFLHSSLPVNDAIDMLIRGVVHVEPSIGEAASSALRRLTGIPLQLTAVLRRLNTFIFSPDHFDEKHSASLVPECLRLLNLWLSSLTAWATVKQSEDTLNSMTAEDDSLFEQLESSALFLLSFTTRSIRSCGVSALKCLIAKRKASQAKSVNPQQLCIADLIANSKASWFKDIDHGLEVSFKTRLAQLQNNKQSDLLFRVAESNDSTDWTLLLFILPAFIRACMDHGCQGLIVFREMVLAAELRVNPTMLQLSGITSRTQPGQTLRSPTGSVRDRDLDKTQLVDQWHMWIKLMCATATILDLRTSAGHSRTASDALAREKLQTARGTFRHMAPFLDCEFRLVREATVMALSAIHRSGYINLLEDLAGFRRHFWDDVRSKSKSAPRTLRQSHLHLACAHVYFLTGHFIQDNRSTSTSRDPINLLVTYITETQSFFESSDVRSDWRQQRLRRFYCGAIRQLFDGLSRLEARNSFVPSSLPPSLYRLCKTWFHPTGLPANLTERWRDPIPESALSHFRTESNFLSIAASGALSALSRQALNVARSHSSSPVVLDDVPPLATAEVLDDISGMLFSMIPTVSENGRKALKSLMSSVQQPEDFLREILLRSFVPSSDKQKSKLSFFQIVTDTVCNISSSDFSFADLMNLGLFNLGHTSKNVRQLAYDVLEMVHTESSGMLSLSQFETAVANPTPFIYRQAQQQISEFLAGLHPSHAEDVVIQCSTLLPLISTERDDRANTLKYLEHWIPPIDLQDDSSEANVSSKGEIVLLEMFRLTVAFSDAHPVEIQALWARLVDEHSSNGRAVVKFVVDQAIRSNNFAFLGCGIKVVAFLSHTIVGRSTLEGLCSLIDARAMLTTPNRDSVVNSGGRMKSNGRSVASILFPDQAQHPIGTGQISLLLLSEVSFDRAWELGPNVLPILLHAILTHVDHRYVFVRERCRNMLISLLRAWMAGYDELADRMNAPSRTSLKQRVRALEAEGADLFWDDSTAAEDIVKKMARLCNEVLALLVPLQGSLQDAWGALALDWVSNCPVRTLAIHSLQTYRALSPQITAEALSTLLARLSSTASSPEQNIQEFTREILLTVSGISSTKQPYDIQLAFQMFWAAYASLATTVEEEFLQSLSVLHSLLDQVDLCEHSNQVALLQARPAGWSGLQGPSAGGAGGLQPLVILGLRSSYTSAASIRLLRRLAELDEYLHSVIDSRGLSARVRDLFAVMIPWCIEVMETANPNGQEVEIRSLVSDVSHLAGANPALSGIARVADSFVKGRFRNVEAFAQQSVSALREHHVGAGGAGSDWKELLALVLGLVLNSQEWLRIRAMTVIKMLLSQWPRDPAQRRGPALAGLQSQTSVDSELLMPLLSLLNTNLARVAVDVLGEPALSVKGSGPAAARRVLRVSMHIPDDDPFDANEEELHGSGGLSIDVFGVPEESGWCIPHPELRRDTCRANVLAVFQSITSSQADADVGPSRPSWIEFEPESANSFVAPWRQSLSEDEIEPGTDMGNLVQNLQELSLFFRSGNSSGRKASISTKSKRASSTPFTLPARHLEARVAAILGGSDVPSDARSNAYSQKLPTTTEADENEHQMESLNFSDAQANSSLHRDEYSDDEDSDFETDAFVFDLPQSKH